MFFQVKQAYKTNSSNGYSAQALYTFSYSFYYESAEWVVVPYLPLQSIIVLIQ